MIALYARVSTGGKGQETGVQTRRLRDRTPGLRTAAGEAIKVYEDQAFATDRRGRREWCQMKEDGYTRMPVLARINSARRAPATRTIVASLGIENSAPPYNNAPCSPISWINCSRFGPIVS